MSEKKSYCRAESYYKCDALNNDAMADCVGYEARPIAIRLNGQAGACIYCDLGNCLNQKLHKGNNAATN